MPFDIDGDGFIDILANSNDNFNLVWYRNTNGQGDFEESQTLNNVPTAYLRIIHQDIDSDGDKDLLFLENNPNRIQWMENLDGNGNFGIPQLIFERIDDYVNDISLMDINNDGHFDLLMTYQDFFTHSIVWRENINGIGTFENEIVIIGETENITFPTLADINNDGLIDFVTAHEENFAAKLVWYENLGDSTFSQENAIFQYQYSASDWTSVYGIQMADINTDGIEDIAYSTVNDDIGSYFYWIPGNNTGTSFEEPILIPNITFGNLAYDMDNDGDVDMLRNLRQIDEIRWKVNNGEGIFSDDILITTQVDFPIFSAMADLNGDGFLDLISASIGDDKIAWYPSSGIFGIEDNSLNTIQAVPNPTNGIVSLISEAQIKKVIVNDMLGRQLNNVYKEETIDLTNAPIGIYLVAITFENGRSEVLKVIKQ